MLFLEWTLSVCVFKEFSHFIKVEEFNDRRCFITFSIILLSIRSTVIAHIFVIGNLYLFSLFLDQSDWSVNGFQIIIFLFH